MSAQDSLFKNVFLTLKWGLVAGLLWGMVEAAVLLLSSYRGLIGQDGVGMSNLFLAALVNYGFLGLILGLASAAYLTVPWFLFRKIRIDFSHRTYFTLSFAVLILVLWAGVYANRVPLARIPLSHPFSIGTSFGIIFAGLAVLFVAYTLLSRSRSAAAAAPLFSFATLLKLAAVPAVVLCGAFVVHQFTKGDRAAGQNGQVGLNGEVRSVTRAHVQRRLQGPPDIILITVETLRADHLNLYGYEKKLNTPNIERLSREGVTFTRYYTNASWTRASITSIMTSLLPQQHGATGLSVTLMDSIATLPKILAENGYHTAAFVTNLNSKSRSFGFSEVYYDEIIESFKNPLAVSPFSIKPFLVRRLLGTKNQLSQDFPFVFPTEFVNDWYPDAASVNSYIEKWLKTAPGQPLFIHIHYLDPHEPYLSHPYRAVQFNLKSKWTRDRIVNLYDQEIEYLDSQLGRLLEILAAAGRKQNSLILFTSDHGEEFLDHGGWGHGNHLFNETLHVPLIVRFPAGRYSGQSVQASVSSIDLAPTILHLLGIEAPASFEGQSLIPLIEGHEEGERVITAHLQAPSFEVVSMMREGMKFISRTGFNAGKYLFNLSVDPREQNNLIDEYPEIAAELEAELAQLDQQLKRNQHRGRQIKLTEEQKRRLRALGYLK
ncbi:MAG: sulfatase [bacterium]